MLLKRWGANRNSGATKLFDKKANISWSPSKNLLTMTISRVSHANQGQFNYSVELTMEDVQQLLAALSKECSVPTIAEGMGASVRDLLRLQLAAAGFTPNE